MYHLQMVTVKSPLSLQCAVHLPILKLSYLSVIDWPLICLYMVILGPLRTPLGIVSLLLPYLINKEPVPRIRKKIY